MSDRPQRPRFVIHLEPTGDFVGDVDRTLARLLKVAYRRFRFRCRHVSEVPPEKP